MIYFLDKPIGITSFDCIRIMQRMGMSKKIGHAGTLDPFASGLMILASDSDTKQIESFLTQDKTYECEITFGKETDSWDSEGKITETLSKEMYPKITQEKIQMILEYLLGEKEYLVPLTSAIKINGKKLYEYAHNNTKAENIPEIPKRMMCIYESTLLFDNLDVEFPIISICLKVSKGTYIRSITQAIAKELGTIAFCSNLKRTHIGEYSLEKDINLVLDSELVTQFQERHFSRIIKK